jgi:hypothetical protein
VNEHPDDLELVLRKWEAEETIIREAYRISELVNLDPTIAEDLDEAYVARDKGVILDAQLRSREALDDALKDQLPDTD